MRGVRCLSLSVGVAGTLLLLAPLPTAAARHQRRFVVGPGNLVAPLVIPVHPRPGPVPHCGRPRLACVKDSVARLRQRERRLGCDHRAVFATTYRVLTEVALHTVQSNPQTLRFRRYFYFEDSLFLDIYLANSRAWEEGRRVSPAWQIAFEQAASGDLNAAQDMLLGINAHVQNDMPFVIAALGTRTRNGTSRKPDHEKENEILASAYQPVIDAVRRRYDPFLEVSNSSLTPLDDFAGLELVRQWREDVWTHANELIAAKTPSERAEVVSEIEQNAASWATMISGSGLAVPGYRAQRDAYCAAHNPDA